MTTTRFHRSGRGKPLPYGLWQETSSCPTGVIMNGDLRPAYGGPDLFGQLAATDPYQRRARRLFERGQVAAVNGNEADVRVGVDASGGALELKGVPIASGYVPRVGDWVAIQYEAGHSAAPWVVGPSMAGDASSDPAGIGVFAISDAAPLDPPKSTIYFDDTLDTWRGWDGSQWVDFFAKLHNTLPDLQGGTASEYYHFSQASHDSLARFIGAAGYPNGLADGYVQRLHFAAIDASHTERTRFFEKDGDFYWAINAEYDAANDRWNRIDTAKYAYLIGLYSKNGIPHEPGDLGGVAWWRATPGSDPIGDYTAVGGWELGFMMTMHRNFVMGGMNCEIDGAGSPPYGRFSQSGHEDPDNFTGILRNVWYEGNTLHSPPVAGEGSWGRDTTDHPGWMAGVVDGVGFVWRYIAAGAGAFPTTSWTQLMSLTAAGVLSVSGYVTAPRLYLNSAAYLDGAVSGLAALTGNLQVTRPSGSNPTLTIITANTTDDAVLNIWLAGQTNWEFRGYRATGELRISQAGAVRMQLSPSWAGPAVRFGDGAANAPAISHINDVDTGVFLQAADVWAVATGGVEQVRVSGSGTLDLRNAAGSLLVNGTKVVGARRAHIADATTDTTVLRDTVNAILAALEGHGLLASG